jgi:hypothetical protein
VTAPETTSPTYPRWLWAVAAAVVVVVGLAITGLVVIDSGDDVTAGDGAIERLIPIRNAQILQQEPIGAQLSAGYEASLALNDRPIPDEQLNRVEGLNQVTFQPGPGRAVTELQAGQNCVTVTYWRAEFGRDDSSRFTWCFTVL